jgi:TolB-like protein/Flp pilus assembly protein TadD
VSLQPGTTLGPYEIVAPLGAGGMGEVYRARDPRLGRDVAIKVLTEAFARDPLRLERFEREARAIAALSHPNVLALYDVGMGDVPFLVTELLEGETLRAVLERGPLQAPRTVAVAMEIAAGLAAAHGRGIVHRDLKPENIFVSSQAGVKILDFGLATSDEGLVGGAGSDPDLTRAPLAGDAIFGTVGYMAPEQMRGARADPRSDIFALGAILHEMLSGERAFRGASPADTMSAVLREQPPDLVTGGQAPAALARIVIRCLEKDPVERFQTARDLRGALESLSGVAIDARVSVPPAEERSIAVPPFTDMSPRKDQAYFCEGMAEEIINALARVDGLRVAARTSTFHFSARTQDLRELAGALRVRTVLEGSVRTAGQRLRVTAQLVDVSDRRAIWSDRFEGDMEDVFAIQDEIAGRIASGLKGRLIGETVRPLQRPTKNLEAYHLYMKGRHHRYVTYDLTEALRCFEQAVEKDPEYAPALAALAYVTCVLAFYGSISPGPARTRVSETLTRALSIDPGLPAVHTGLAQYYFHLEYNWPEALKSYERALALDPDDADTHLLLATFHAMGGDRASADLHAGRGLALEPLSAWGHGLAGLTAYMDGDLERAARHARDALEIRPDTIIGEWVLGAALSSQGQTADALGHLERAMARIGEAPYLLALVAHAHAVGGDPAKAVEIFDALDAKARRTYVSPLWTAVILCGLGRADDALDRLIGGLDGGAAGLGLITGRFFDSLRGNPRFATLVRRMNLPASCALPR